MRITNAKTQRFLFYQSNRNKYKNGGKRKRAKAKEEVPVMHLDNEFNSVTALLYIVHRIRRHSRK
jgi:hypothetical protein